ARGLFRICGGGRGYGPARADRQRANRDLLNASPAKPPSVPGDRPAASRYGCGVRLPRRAGSRPRDSRIRGQRAGVDGVRPPPTQAPGGSQGGLETARRRPLRPSEALLFENSLQPSQAAAANETDGTTRQRKAPRHFIVGQRRLLEEKQLDHLLATG